MLLWTDLIQLKAKIVTTAIILSNLSELIVVINYILTKTHLL